jgi:hypothetical protein
MKLKKTVIAVASLFIGMLALETGRAHGETFGIDYSDPSAYLQSGSQTTLTSHNEDTIRQKIGKLGNGMKDVKAIFLWKKRNFKTEHAKGSYLGTRTVNDSMKSYLLTGCNDHANLLAAVLRLYEIPAIVVNAAGIQWARNYVDRSEGVASGPSGRMRRAANANKGLIGHAFVEAYVEGRWILINSTSGEYVPQKYNPTDPVIPMPSAVEPVGYYSYSKALDQASSGVHGMKDQRKQMTAAAPRIAGSSIDMPKYETERFAPEGRRRLRGGF